MAIKLVLDTNAIFRLPRRTLDGPLLTSIKHSRDNVQIIVPEIVKHELLKLFDEKLQKCQMTFDKAYQEFHDIVGPRPILEAVANTAGAANRYRADLEHSFRKHHVVVTPVSSLSFQAIVERSVAKRPPFAANGRGFKDAVVWETVLQHASPGTRLALITDDGDFIVKDSRLHEELNGEIKQRGLTPGEFSVFRSLADFSTAWIESQLGVADLAQFVETGLLDFFGIGDISPEEIAQRIRESALLDEDQVGSLIGAKVLYARLADIGESPNVQYEGQEAHARCLQRHKRRQSFTIPLRLPVLLRSS